MTTRTGKKTAAILLALSAGIILAGCDSVEALPANYESPIVVNDSDNTKVDVYDNIMGVIYDGISTGKKDDVLNNFIKIVANDQIGTYKELKAVHESGDKTKFAEYVQKHKGIFVHENKIQIDGGEITEDEYLASKFSTTDHQVTPEMVQAQRVEDFYNAVNKKIHEAFYNEIVSKSYNDDTGMFHEERLAYAHFAEMYDIDLTKEEWFSGYLTPSLKKEDVSSFIHLSDGRYDDYIERKLIPTIYKDKLVEEYLLRNNYSTIGRAYGRKVNVIKLTRDEKFKDLPGSLLKAFAENYIEANTPDFEIAANAWRGFHGLNADGTVIPLTAEEETLLESAGLVKSTGGWYEATQYGQMMKKYTLAQENLDKRYASEEAQTAISEFTGSFTHTIEEGLKVKLAELALSDYTTDGWFVKNGGLTDLPEEIRNRLFNISVSREVDSIDPATYEYKQSDYVRYVNGHYYLTPAVSESGDDLNYIMYNEGSYYIVEVVEAVATSKLDIDGSEGYVANRPEEGYLFTETVAREIAATLGTKDSYINNAYAFFIKKYSVEYHDSAIYDYFKEKFPELFEENK
ncbi:MAG: hypothetical protein MJ221_02635 [Bacilli bacterium]|nr:hypothetical protein [Bacilli bacterium]